MNIAIIPARGGSKRIPGKNVKAFMGKPMLAYSIEAAKKSGLFDKVIVSTDSETIADVAREYGAEVPFIRPPEFSDDFTPLFAVLEHAIGWLNEHDIPCTYICNILATAPFVRVEDLIAAHKLITKKKVSSVFTVTTFGFPIFRSLKINEKGALEMFWPEHELTRSNDLPEAYHDAGQFYWLDTEKFLQTKKIYAKDAVPLILPRYLVQDIDTPEDWERGEIMYKTLMELKKI